jgi:hypothetical protein
MSGPPRRPAAVADQRHLISEALDRTLVVEAAAGTGKTTELVNRVVRLIETGAASIEHIVAVTFSEKAAGELKLRLREQLEQHLVSAPAGNAGAVALARAVQHFEEAHVSTIHGFCADLLRERPVEARIDPSFEVLTESGAARLFDEAFSDWMQEQLQSPAPGVKRALRRMRTRFNPDDEDDGPINRIRNAGWELLQWRDHPASWTRPEGFNRERDMEVLLDALKTFDAISGAPVDQGDLLYRETRRLRHAHQEIDQLRSRGLPDFEGWEARLCELAGHERDLRKGRNTRGMYARNVPRESVCLARDLLSTHSCVSATTPTPTLPRCCTASCRHASNASRSARRAPAHSTSWTCFSTLATWCVTCPRCGASSSGDSASSSSTSFRIPIRCRRTCCGCWPPTSPPPTTATHSTCQFDEALYSSSATRSSPSIDSAAPMSVSTTACASGCSPTAPCASCCRPHFAACRISSAP